MEIEKTKKHKKHKKASLQITSIRVHRWVVTILQIIMSIGLVLAIYKRHWQDVFTIAGIVFVMVVPLAIGKRQQIQIPPEFELMAILFVFASLYLGELHGYYTKFWWWDIVLHTTSGLLMGIFGFLLVYLLNKDDRINLKMRPFFIAFFAFMFAVAFGSLWEIFEFTMDQLAGQNMQKPMLGDPSGLTDTMWDLIVNTIGAAVISTIGWWHLKMKRNSIFDVWIKKFILFNPQLFTKNKKRSKKIDE